MRSLRFVLLTILFMVFLAVGVGQQVITTTSTTVITLPGSLYTTVIEVPGGEMTMTVQYPGYVEVMVERRPDQVCTLVITPVEAAETTFVITGTTIKVPGTTFMTSLEMANPSTAFTTTYVTGGETVTSTGFEVYEVITSNEIPGVTTYVLTLELPVYGEIVKSCEEIEVVIENTLSLETAPATVILAWSFPGATYTIPGTTFTITIPTEFIGEEISPTTKLTTESGTTYTTTITHEGTTYVTIVSQESTTMTTVITEPGQVITSTVTYTTTLPETAGTPTGTEATTTFIPPPPPPPPKTKTAGPVMIGGVSLGTIIIALAAILVLVGALLFFFRR